MRDWVNQSVLGAYQSLWVSHSCVTVRLCVFKQRQFARCQTASSGNRWKKRLNLKVFMSLCFFLLLLTQWLCQQVRLSPGVLRVSLIRKYNENNQLKQITHFRQRGFLLFPIILLFLILSTCVYNSKRMQTLSLIDRLTVNVRDSYPLTNISQFPTPLMTSMIERSTEKPNSAVAKSSKTWNSKANDLTHWKEPWFSSSFERTAMHRVFPSPLFQNLPRSDSDPQVAHLETAPVASIFLAGWRKAFYITGPPEVKNLFVHRGALNRRKGSGRSCKLPFVWPRPWGGAVNLPYRL